MQLQTDKGRVLLPEWVLPCGEPSRSDLFVVRRPAGLGEAAAAAAAAGQGAALTPSQLDAIRLSQAKKGENSYYYAVHKHSGDTLVPSEPRVPKAVYAPSHAAVREQTIASYSIADGADTVKVHIPIVGARRLPSNGVCVGLFDRSFKLAIRPDAGTELSLNVPLLCEPINQNGCSVKALEGKLVLSLAKREPDRVRRRAAFASFLRRVLADRSPLPPVPFDFKKQVWYELRKTKGVGDTEYDKLVPWDGELVALTCGGSGEALPPEAAPVCPPGPPRRR